MRRRYLFSPQGGLQTVPEKEIWYTSTNGQAIAPYNDGDLLIETNLYSGGKYVMRFSNVVNAIPDNMFNNLTGMKYLKSVALPASVTKIGAGAFANCTKLTEVVFCGAPPAYSDSYPVSYRAAIYVPDTLVNDYMTDRYWSSYQNQIKPWSEHV